MTAPEPGTYPGVPDDEYRAWPCANSSALKLFKQSQLHARESQLGADSDTPAKFLGRAIHSALLEPDLFASTYVVAPKFDRRTKVGKLAAAEFDLEHSGCVVLTPEQRETCEAVREAAARHPLVSALLAGPGENELSFVWEDSDTGVLCKGRADRLTVHQGESVCLDPKSAKDASWAGFQKAIGNYDYPLQAAFYLDGLATIAPRERRFLWLAFETSAPYGVAVYEPPALTLELGRFWYKRHLAQYAEALKSGIWPGYPEVIQPLEAPAWAMREAENAPDLEGGFDE